ncbi:MAG: thioredoxin family protein [Desulfobacterales bacterium]|jgi:thioredoxin-related protein
MGIQQRISRLAGIVLLLGLGLLHPDMARAADSPASGIKWYSYQEGLALGKQENKKVFLTFYADWCSYCHKMDKESFRNPEIADYLRRHFISVKANSDRETQLAQDFFVRGLPSSWFLSAKGEKIAGQPGYIPPKQLLQLLKFIQSDSYKDMSLKEFVQGN